MNLESLNSSNQYELAKKSRNINQTLCLVFLYSNHGFPSPTINLIL